MAAVSGRGRGAWARLARLKQAPEQRLGSTRSAPDWHSLVTGQERRPGAGPAEADTTRQLVRHSSGLPSARRVRPLVVTTQHVNKADCCDRVQVAKHKPV
jgi:hypothetical protein